MSSEKYYNKNQIDGFVDKDFGIEIELVSTADSGGGAEVSLGEHEWPPAERIDAASDLQLILWARYLPIANNSKETNLFNRIKRQILERKLLFDIQIADQKDYKKIISHKAGRVRKFKNIPAFSELDEDQLQKVMKQSEIKHYPAGATIIDKNSQDHRIHYLYDGKAKVVGNDIDLYTVKRRGDILGELNDMYRSRRNFSVHAVEDTTCIITIQNSERPQEKSKNNAVLIKTLMGTNQMLKDRLELTTQQLERARAAIQKLRSGKRPA